MAETLTLTTKTTVRAGTLADLDACVRMGQHFLADSAYRAFAGDDTNDAVKRLLTQFLSGQLGQLYVATRDDEIVGVIGVLVYENPITGRMTGSELFWWVEPAARSTRAGLLLMRAAEQWARAHGATSLQMISWHGRLDHFYECLGYTPMERVWQKEWA